METKKQKHLAAQYIYQNTLGENSYGFLRARIDEQDREFLTKPPASCFVFITKQSARSEWTVRLASETQVEDIRMESKLDYLQVLRRLRGELEDRDFQVAIVITKIEIIAETINGTDEEMDKPRERVHRQMMNANIGAQEPEGWHFHHLNQMEKAGTVQLINHRMEIYI